MTSAGSQRGVRGQHLSSAPCPHPHRQDPLESSEWRHLRSNALRCCPVTCAMLLRHANCVLGAQPGQSYELQSSAAHDVSRDRGMAQ